MAKSDLVASKFLCLTVKISSSHTGAEITRRFFHIVNCIKDLSLKHCDRNSEKFGVVFDHRTVGLIISRVHHKKYQFKRKLVMTFQFLEQFCHQHGILSAGNTDSYFISFFYQFILFYCFGKRGPDGFAKFFADALLYLIFNIFGFLSAHLFPQPCNIAAFQAVGTVAFCFQFLCCFYAVGSMGTEQDHFFWFYDLWITLQIFLWNVDGSRNGSVLKIPVTSHIDQLITSLRKFIQFSYVYFHVYITPFCFWNGHTGCYMACFCTGSKYNTKFLLLQVCYIFI